MYSDLLNEDPSDDDAKLRLVEEVKQQAKGAFGQKDMPGAELLYGKAISLLDSSPGKSEAALYSNRAMVRLNLGKVEQALEDANKCIEIDAKFLKAYHRKAQALIRLNKWDDAIVAAKQGQELEPTNASFQELVMKAEKAKAQAKLKRDAQDVSEELHNASTAQVPPGKKEKKVESAGKEDEGLASTPASATEKSANGNTAAAQTPLDHDEAAAAKEAGNAKYKEGAYREALTQYQRALDHLPPGNTERRVPLLGNVAAAYLMLRRASDCCSVCEEALALDPTSSKIRARLATAQVALGDLTAARATLKEVNGDAALVAAAKQLADTESSLATADASLSKGEPAKALGLYADLETRVLFNCPGLALKMGRCYLALKNYPRVLNTTQQVLRANPRNIDALVLRTEALYHNNTSSIESRQFTEPLEQGQKLLKEALSFDPDHSGAQALRKRLRQLCAKHVELKAAIDNREFQQAQEILDSMIEQCPDNQMILANIYVQRAQVGVRLKDWRGVLKDVGQATYRNHDLVQPYLFRAQALQNLDRHEDAVKELEGLFSWHRDQTVYDKLHEAKFLLRKKKRANYYELLGVPSIASQLEIKKAYRERAAEWHPDKKGHLDEEAKKNAETMFKRIGEAYEVLTDPQKKELYDKGYDLEGIDEQIELKKRRTEGCGQGQRCGGCG